MSTFFQNMKTKLVANKHGLIVLNFVPNKSKNTLISSGFLTVTHMCKHNIKHLNKECICNTI